MPAENKGSASKLGTECISRFETAIQWDQSDRSKLVFLKINQILKKRLNSLARQDGFKNLQGLSSDAV